MSLEAPGYRPPERILIHTYDGQQWTKVASEMAVETKPFANGAFREAYRTRLSRIPGAAPQLYVCKFGIDANTPKTLYLHDVEAQVYAASWAAKFNEFLPSAAAAAAAGLPPVAPVCFVEAFVVELVDRPGRPLAGCEPFIAGDFAKHNNNVGAVADAPAAGAGAGADADVSGAGAGAGGGCAGGGSGGGGGPESEAITIANAFSHFTYAKSGGKILICDIQGVNDTYTDPQIHTLSGKGFGVGNLGYTGIRAFLLRHRCNGLCGLMGLPKIQTKDLGDEAAAAAAATAAAAAARPVAGGAAPAAAAGAGAGGAGATNTGPAASPVAPSGFRLAGINTSAVAADIPAAAATPGTVSAGTPGPAAAAFAGAGHQQRPSFFSSLDGQLDLLLDDQSPRFGPAAPAPGAAAGARAAATATSASAAAGGGGGCSAGPATPARPLSAFGQRLKAEAMLSASKHSDPSSSAAAPAASAGTGAGGGRASGRTLPPPVRTHEHAHDPISALDLSASWDDEPLHRGAGGGAGVGAGTGAGARGGAVSMSPFAPAAPSSMTGATAAPSPDAALAWGRHLSTNTGTGTCSGGSSGGASDGSAPPSKPGAAAAPAMSTGAAAGVGTGAGACTGSRSPDPSEDDHGLAGLVAGLSFSPEQPRRRCGPAASAGDDFATAVAASLSAAGGGGGRGQTSPTVPAGPGGVPSGPPGASPPAPQQQQQQRLSPAGAAAAAAGAAAGAAATEQGVARRLTAKRMDAADEDLMADILQDAF